MLSDTERQSVKYDTAEDLYWAGEGRVGQGIRAGVWECCSRRNSKYKLSAFAWKKLLNEILKALLKGNRVNLCVCKH